MKIIMIIIYDKRFSNTGKIITYIDYNVYNYSVNIRGKDYKINK